LEKFGNGKGKLANASEEGQGPRRDVEPMMMMMIKYKIVQHQNEIHSPNISVEIPHQVLLKE
jgi:hypothetical protein